VACWIGRSRRLGGFFLETDTSNPSIWHFYGSELGNGGLYYYLQALVADMSVSSDGQNRRCGVGDAGGIESARRLIATERF
jgi:hypothetical protein